jgi:hypothetical protein
MVNFMIPFLKLGNCVKFCVIPIKVLHKLDLSKIVIKFSHCFLMSKVNVDMSPIPSFLYMNWNELELNFFKMLKCSLRRLFCSTLVCFYLIVIKFYVIAFCFCSNV